jgi:hypothetical protein
MKEYLCVMMTARGCGHCAHSRGNGIMGSGPHFMKISTINEFLSLGDNFNFLNIHYDNMSGKTSLIREISKFYKQGDLIIEEFWALEEEKTRYFRVEANTKTKKIKQSGTDDIGMDWVDFVKSKVPEKIENYAYYYPCFLITKTENWKNSLTNNSELYALTNAGKTRIQKGKVFLDKDGKSFNERMVDPKDLVKNVISGKEKIEPHIKDTPVPVKDTPVPVKDTPVPVKDTPVPVKDTPVPVKDTPVKEDPIHFSHNMDKYIIRQY